MNPPESQTVWEENSPDSLVDLAARVIINNPHTYMEASHENGSFLRVFPRLLPGLHLPTEICEKLFCLIHDDGLDISDETAAVFSDPDRSRLRSVSVRDATIGDKGLRHLLRHELTSLDVHNCVNLSRRSLEAINRHSMSLLSLNVGNSVQILPDCIMPADDALEDSLDEVDDGIEDATQRSSRQSRSTTVYDERGYIIWAPNLRRLSIRDLFISGGCNYLELLLKPMPQLLHLDLSGVGQHEGLGDFSFLRQLPALQSLVLHNVIGIDSATETLASIHTLRHLDLSHSDEKVGYYAEPNKTLDYLVTNLPQLSSLDISGTNLAGTGAFECSIDVSCDIPGLASRTETPLEFLGLYKTAHEASYRQQIPALKISGDSSEAQILVAGRQYLDRPSMLENVLNDLFHLFRYENCENLKGALDIILMAMDRHPAEKVIQISGSASLYYVVKSEIKANINIKMKKKILSTLLNGMFTHKNDAVMMRNGCLTLCQFSIPQDVLCDYERLVKILLFIITEHNDDANSFVQRAGIYLLNSLACQVDGQQKLLVGNLGAMEKMLELIRERVRSGNCDDVMETAWSCMWNVTDETPVNCRRFLDGGGMKLFLQCKEQFPDKQDLLRNMMGLLGNVAEVKSLRPFLMTKEFVFEFSQLLDSHSDGIEVSYNAAGVLAHMASDGPTAWLISDPTREAVLSRMVLAIERWSLDTKRNINYRSFEPILRLVRVTHTPQCQHWAIWALANLTTVDNKYCSLVEQEDGLSLLEELINSNLPQLPYTRVLELAAVVRDNVNRWKEKAATNRPIVMHDEDLDFDG